MLAERMKGVIEHRCIACLREAGIQLRDILRRIILHPRQIAGADELEWLFTGRHTSSTLNFSRKSWTCSDPSSLYRARVGPRPPTRIPTPRGKAAKAASSE